MADKTRIDPDEARAENAKLKNIAARFQSSVDKLKAEAAAKDGCWGGDKFGEAFAKGYKPGATQMLDNSGKIEEGVVGTTKQVDQALADFEKTDEYNSKNL
ncbi:WXG100 family type VII secretion target [Lentzea kentuckyensis]|uniref:WXG100 family type VII secretion target n=1 Tax=Lentzea kentuckyensis TaxID=360086 RepID=UPI000A36FE27|nr:WXG100 family type VII secretion target [Lentzea kentuckyensis]